MNTTKTLMTLRDLIDTMIELQLENEALRDNLTYHQINQQSSAAAPANPIAAPEQIALPIDAQKVDAIPTDALVAQWIRNEIADGDHTWRSPAGIAAEISVDVQRVTDLLRNGDVPGVRRSRGDKEVYCID